MAFRKIEAGLVHAPVDEFIGKTGTIFYDNDLGDFRISDGQTPGGIALSFGGGEGGTYTLPTATTTVKGGVKIDGTTIAIANQVIRVGTVPYSSLSGTPTIPTNNNQLTNGAAYITSAALSGLATESYVTTRGYLTTVAYADVTGKPTLFSGSYADLTNKPTLFSGSYVDLTNKPTIPTNNNELTNGAGYITSSALTGLASETYVTTRGYLTTVAYADVTNKPTLFSGSYVDLTNKPTIPTDINQLTDASGLLGQGGGGSGTTYITNTVENPYSFSIAGDDSTLREIASGESIKITGAGGITVTTDAEGNLTITGTPVSLAGYATESYVTSRGYITGLSYNDLTDKPNLAGTYTFNVAADDSTMREISSEETVKFVGAGGITTASDAEGKITITQGTTSSLVNGANTVSLGSTGILTFPNGALTVTGNKIRNVNESVGLIAGSEIEVTVAKTVISNGLTDTEGLSNQHIFEVGSTRIFSAYQVINTLGDGEGGPSLTGQQLTELTSTGFQIGQRVINDPGGESEPLTSFSGWTFGTVGQSQAITFPDATVQSTAWTGVADYNNLINKPSLAGTYTWSIAADDSTLREILTNESVKFIGSGGVTTASDAEGNITITGPSLTGLATETYVTTQGYITSSALTGLATETYVNQAVTNLVDGAPAMLDTLKELALSLNNDSNLAATLVTEINKKANIADLVLTIAGDDSTEKTISLGEGIRLQGTGSITITTDLEGKVTINGAAPDLSAYALTSAVPTNNNQLSNGAGYITTAVNANGTFSLPILSAEPANLQAGQIALANGTSWDPLDKAEGRLYTALYTGTGWIEIGGLTENKAYGMILGG